MLPLSDLPIRHHDATAPPLRPSDMLSKPYGLQGEEGEAGAQGQQAPPERRREDYRGGAARSGCWAAAGGCTARAVLGGRAAAGAISGLLHRHAWRPGQPGVRRPVPGNSGGLQPAGPALPRGPNRGMAMRTASGGWSHSAFHDVDRQLVVWWHPHDLDRAACACSHLAVRCMQMLFNLSEWSEHRGAGM